jgi:GAG-pre-integrase domain
VPPKDSKLHGIANNVRIEGVGHVAWSMEDVHGMLRTIKVPCFFVPQVHQCLLSIPSLLQEYPNESVSMEGNKLILSGSTKDKTNLIEVFTNPKNNLPTTKIFDHSFHHKSIEEFAALTLVVTNENINLPETSKVLLRWHYQLAHIDFNKIKMLFRSGVLSHATNNCHLHTKASKITMNPQCAACHFGKQCKRSVPTTTQAKVCNKVGG